MCPFHLCELLFSFSLFCLSSFPPLFSSLFLSFLMGIFKKTTFFLFQQSELSKAALLEMKCTDKSPGHLEEVQVLI